MPNWTENNLLVKKKDWDKFKEVAFDKDGEITFKILIPHPESVKADIYYNHFITNDPHGMNIEEDLDKYKDISADFFSDYNGEKIILYHRFKAQHPELDTIPGWYNWQYRNWGTKWDASESYVDNIDEIDDLDDEDDLVVRFNTAWSGPVHWFEKLSHIIPFFVTCTDECGVYHWTCTSDGKGNFDLEDDTEEFFQSLEEDEDDEEEENQ